MKVTKKSIAFLTHNYFEQDELEVPLKMLQNIGALVTIISADKLQLQALRQVDKSDKFQADLLLKDADPRIYDAIVLPGGVVNSDALRISKSAQCWVKEFIYSDRLVAMVCHAPWLLVSADIAEGRRVTSYHTIKDDIVNAGAEWIDQPVVVDNNLITSRKPDDLRYFNEEIKKQLFDRRDSSSMNDI